MEILITLCARSGSKGIPNKNVKPINGQPLIALSIRVAKQFAERHGADIALSTDGDMIAEVAAGYGIATDYRRPEKLATDSAGKLDAIADLLLYEENARRKQYDYVLDLDISSPLRNLADLEAAFATLQADEKARNLFSVNRAHRNPYFNMVEKQPNGYYGLVKKGHFLTRQSAPEVYDLNASFYFYRRTFFATANMPVINEFTLIYQMNHICFDLDETIDFEFMEYLLSNHKLNFEL